MMQHILCNITIFPHGFPFKQAFKQKVGSFWKGLKRLCPVIQGLQWIKVPFHSLLATLLVDSGTPFWCSFEIPFKFIWNSLWVHLEFPLGSFGIPFGFIWNSLWVHLGFPWVHLGFPLGSCGFPFGFVASPLGSFGIPFGFILDSDNCSGINGILRKMIGKDGKQYEMDEKLSHGPSPFSLFSKITS